MTANLQDIQWDDLRILLAFAEQKTLAATARALRLDATTVSRRLKSLELVVGAALLLQDGKLLGLSPVGLQVVQSARSMRDVATTMVRDLGAQETRADGVVRLTAVPMILNKLIVPELRTLRAAHPGLVLHMLGSSRNLALGIDEADVAIRLGRPARAELVGRKLFDVPYVVAGPRDAGWVAWADAYHALPEAAWVRAHVAASQVIYRSSDTEQMAETVRAGLAQGLLPRFLCAGIRHSKVVLVREAWLVLHRDTRDIPRIRALADWLVAARPKFVALCGKVAPRKERCA
jgi:DNA-binding transcriptional LysR family regulator